MNKQYNKKLDYLVSKFTIASLDIWEIAEQKIKDIYNEKINPSNRHERQMLKIKKCLNILKKQSILTIEIIDRIYKILCNYKKYNYSKDELINLLKSSNEIIVLLTILKEKIFSKYNFEMAVLIFNYIRFVKDLIPVVIYPKVRDEILLNINYKNNYPYIKELVKRAIFKCMKKNVKHAYITTKQLINILNDNKKILLKKYKVRHIYIYGSYAKNEASEYSDLDIYIEVTRKYQKNKFHKKEIINYLKSILPMPLDVHVNDEEFNFETYFSEEIKQTLRKIF